MPNMHARRDGGVKIPPELTNIIGISGAAIAVVAIGSVIAAVLPRPDMMQVVAAYGLPASLAFAVYWWLAQKV